jgi:hypothetical protein
MSGTDIDSEASWYASIGPPAAISPMIGTMKESGVVACGTSSLVRPSRIAAVGVRRMARLWAAPRSR